jgi:hypothetical protein
MAASSADPARTCPWLPVSGAGSEIKYCRRHFHVIRIRFTVSTRRLFVYSALLVFLTTGPVLAGEYQPTKDGKTLVWNENHKPGDLVSWSGKRDADGYATGYGTLTWYVPEDTLEIGSNLPRKHYRVSSRVSGTMVKGKFEEKPSRTTAQAALEPEKPKKRGWFSIFKPRPKPSSAPVEATPQLRPKPPSPRIEATPRETSLAPTNAEASPTPTPTPTPSAASNSLDMHAPSSLKLGSPAASPSPAIPSPAAAPGVSLQPEEPPSPSPTPQ